MESVIESRIKEVAESKGVKSSYELQHALGVAPTVALRLWRGEVTRFSTETLNKLCRTFKCGVGDLLVYIPDKKKQKSLAVKD